MDKDISWYVDQYNRNRDPKEWIDEYVALEVLKLQIKLIEEENKKEKEQDKNGNKKTV